MSKGRRPVLYSYPFDDPGNDYIVHCRNVWSRLGFEVRPFGLKIDTSGTRRRDRVIVLNWLEDWVLASGRPLPIAFAILCAYIFRARAQAGRLVWVRHNLQPNVRNAAPRYRKIAIRLLERLADSVVTHRPMPGIDSVFVPHPTYVDSVDEAGLGGERDIPYLIFGHVRPSKAIERLLDCWPAELPLMLVGKPSSPAYAETIRAHIRKLGLNVTWDDRLVPTAEIEAYLRRARFMVYVNNWDTVIVSGALYHSVSFGVNMLVSDGAFPRFAAGQLAGVTLFSDLTDLATALARAEAVPDVEIVASALAANGPETAARYWAPVLLPSA